MTPLSWADARVGEIATLADGPFGSNLKTSHYVEQGPRVVRLQNIGDGIFRDERAHITDAHFRSLLKHEVLAGDLVVASLGDEPPRAALVPPWLGPAIVKADCIRVRPAEGIEPAFLMSMLNSPPIRRAAAASIKGIGRPRLGLRGIRDLRVPVPPLAEQRRIVAAIEEQFSRLDAADTILRDLLLRIEALRRAALSAPLSRISQTRPLAELASTQLGKMLSSKAKAGVDPRPYLRNKNVRWYGFELDDLLKMDFDEAERAKFSLEPGDVVVCEGGEVGRSAVWRGEVEGCYFQKAVHRVRTTGDLEPEFLVHVMRWLADMNAFERYITGSTINHLPQEDLRTLPIPAPPVEEQRRIVVSFEQQLSLIDSLRAAVESARTRSTVLRRAILGRAFRGELVPQDPDDEPASVLLERIRAARAAAPTSKRRKRVPA